MFNLIRTVGVESTKVDTWTNTVSSEIGDPDTSQNICCNAQTVVHGITGDVLSDPQYLMYTGQQSSSRCSNDNANNNDNQQNPNSGSFTTVNQVKVRPLPTYTEVTVENPVSVLAIFAALGGALSSIDLIASWVAWAIPRVKEEIILKRFDLALNSGGKIRDDRL